MAEVAGVKEQFIEMTVAIDKLDKIGFEGVEDELIKRGFPKSGIDTILSLLILTDLSEWKTRLSESEEGSNGIAEL